MDEQIQAPTPMLGDSFVHQTLEQFEVVVASNLDMPYRWAQKLYWLEVLAASPRQALDCATEWSLDSDPKLEPTNLVRRSEPHIKTMGRDKHGMPLVIDWQLPLADDLPKSFVIRRPEDGIRIGFLAHPKASERWLPPEAQGRFVLIARKPTADAEPVCLAPLCMAINPMPGARLNLT
jgi:hypothetical protein